MGFLQQDMSPAEGGDLIMFAADNGITLFDTAEYYKTASHIGQAVKNGYKDIVVCTKSYAYDEAAARRALENALYETHKDAIDIFLLHETENELTIRGHEEALDFYIKARESGLIKAVGISTHYVAAVQAATQIDDIDIIEALINIEGLGVADGTRLAMEGALQKAKAAGKGIIAMKPLGGGNLYAGAKEAFGYLDGIDAVDSVLCGMVSRDEILTNIAFFNGDARVLDFERLAARQKKLIVEEWCTGCGKCIGRCPNRALFLLNSKAVCDSKRCLCCGYCAASCMEFCLRIITLK